MSKQTVVCYCLHDDHWYLAPSIRSFKQAGDVVAFISKRAWDGSEGCWERCAEVAEAEGAEVVIGEWHAETPHRRDALATLRERGCEYVLIPDGGIRTYSYDLDGRLTVLQDQASRATSFVYDAGNRPTADIDMSGSQQSITYDAIGRKTLVKGRNGSGTLDRITTFGYDAIDNRVTIQDLIGNLSTYSYDAVSRLTQDSTTGPNAHLYDYSYDGLDKRVTANESGTLTTFTYNAAQRLVTSMAGVLLTTYSYDAIGNQILVNTPTGLTTMAYNKENVQQHYGLLPS
jgi:YD repeat-containing protein